MLEGSRHPVVERMMAREAFIPNDVLLDEAGRVILLTGPNMAGKSTLLRQVGLCVVLAQMGAFVPARRAVVGVVDRLFTRGGASGNLVRGPSTFMVEMSETSAILHGATGRTASMWGGWRDFPQRSWGGPGRYSHSSKRVIMWRTSLRPHPPTRPSSACSARWEARILCWRSSIDST